MSTFEDLNLGPEVVEALAAEGIESPTPFQLAAVPVISRGNDILGRAGPGAGTLVGYGAPLLQRLEGGRRAPVCIILCTGRRQATELARSFALLAESTGHRAAAFTEQWNQPQLADFLFVPADEIKALYDGQIPLSEVKAVVLHDGDGILKSVPSDQLETFFHELSADTQRVFCGQPFGPVLATFAERHTKRAVTVPPRPLEERHAQRQTGDRVVQLDVVEHNRRESALDAVVRLLEDTVQHVVVFNASPDQAADIGDFLALHGFHCGALGDASLPIWLATDEDEFGPELGDPRTVATLSVAVPSGKASMAGRHRYGGPAVVLAEVRELGHVKEVAKAAGFDLRRSRPGRPVRVSSRIDELAGRLGELVTSDQLTPYYLLVEALIPKFSAGEVAAAALYLLDEKTPKERQQGQRQAAPAWVRLFVSAGQRDNIGPGEVLGAVTSESGVPGKRVGRIDVRESHALVEVRQEDAQKVIDALNGTTLGGRAIRVDYDRGKEDRKGPPSKGPRREPARR